MYKKIAVVTSFFLMFSIFYVEVNAKSQEQEEAILFSTQVDGDKLTGAFNEWTVEVSTDKQHKILKNLNIQIDMTAATTGNGFYDSSLKGSEWFDVEQYPTASFRSKQIEITSKSELNIKGDLTIRDITQPLNVTAAYQWDSAHEVLLLEGTLALSRLKFGVGLDADPDAEQVGDLVDIEFHINAQPTKK